MSYANVQKDLSIALKILEMTGVVDKDWACRYLDPDEGACNTCSNCQVRVQLERLGLRTKLGWQRSWKKLLYREGRQR